MDMTLRARHQLMTFIDSDARFELPSMDELETNANAYGVGRERARVDGLLESAIESTDDDHDDPTYAKQYEPIGIERLHEILENDQIEWDNLSEVSEGDEYAEWVLDEAMENLEQHIVNLLELAPRELYKD